MRKIIVFLILLYPLLLLWANKVKFLIHNRIKVKMKAQQIALTLKVKEIVVLNLFLVKKKKII